MSSTKSLTQVIRAQEHVRAREPSEARHTGWNLPHELQLEAVRRFRGLLLGLAGMFVIGAGVRHLALALGVEGVPQGTLLDVGTLAWSVISLLVYWGTRQVRQPARVLRLALVYEVLICSDLAALEEVLFQVSAGPPRLSFVAVPILLFPIMVPAPRGARILTTIASVVSLPLTVFVTAECFGDGVSERFSLFLFSPTFMAAGMALYLARLGQHLHHQAGRAVRLGSYVLEERIGQGGMGEVWRAKHELLVRPAAIKLIRPDGEGRLPNEALQRFEREAQSISVLSSPHTVDIYDFGRTEDGAFYYAMELLQGLDLESLVQDHGPQCQERVIHFLSTACCSLADAHDHDLVHRDIKPANLMTCRLGGEFDFLKVLDFGLVKTSEPRLTANLKLSREDRITGTPAYLAPELALGRPVDGRTDLYCLACVAYWLLTGRLVFDGESAMAIAVQHAERAPTAPSQVAEQSISPELDAIILRCLAKDPAERPASARALRLELLSLPQAGAWTPERAEQWWKRHGPALGSPHLPLTRRPPGAVRERGEPLLEGRSRGTPGPFLAPEDPRPKGP